MKRSEFLKLIGVGALVTEIGLPSIAEVDQHIAKVSGTKDEHDSFAVIRKLMKEAAQPDWEYHFIMTGSVDIGYTVHLLQNDNHHLETYYEKVGLSSSFGEREQRWMFDRLMYGVKMFNAQPSEKQEMVRELMKSLK